MINTMLSANVGSHMLPHLSPNINTYSSSLFSLSSTFKVFIISSIYHHSMLSVPPTNVLNTFLVTYIQVSSFLLPFSFSHLFCFDFLQSGELLHGGIPMTVATISGGYHWHCLGLLPFKPSLMMLSTLLAIIVMVASRATPFTFYILLYFTLLFLDRGNQLWFKPYVHSEEFCLLLFPV